MPKYAIRITDGQTTRLFAVVKDMHYVEWLRYEARKTFTYGSLEWLTVSDWSPEFAEIAYGDFPLGD